MMNERNIGHFEIRADYIRDKPEEIATIFSMLKIVPVRAMYLFDCDAIRYLAIGERFEEVLPNCIAPEYEFKITKSKAGNIELVEVIKIGDKMI